MSYKRVKKHDREEAEPAVLRLQSKISSLFELPQEIVMNLPLISIIGRAELCVENYKSVVEYNETTVRINTSSGMFKIEGHQLVLKRLTSESVTITGILTSFGYIA